VAGANDDWRLQVDLHDPRHVSQLFERLDAADLEHDLSAAYRDRVIVSRDGGRVFLYTGTREQAESARGLIERLDGEHRWDATLELAHWHPDAEAWEDPDVPSPGNEAEREVERKERESTERLETELSSVPDFEVRIDLPSRHEAARFAERLQAEGLPTVHRWRYVLIGVESEADGEALAERIRGDAPDGSTVAVEGTWRAAYKERPPNPFAFLGGLAGN
jgi:hypothetical protein